MAFGPTPIPFEQRFWPKVNKTKTCWLWTAGTNGAGYGMFQVQSPEEKQLAHRVSWVLANGPIPKKQKVLHKCDTPACVNPAHLFLGTMKDNSQDMAAKGRAANQHGKMVQEAKRGAIRADYLAGMSQALVGKKYGLHQASISRLVRDISRPRGRNRVGSK